MTKNIATHPLLSVLRDQKAAGLKGSIYHKTQVCLTYNSNHIEGSQLTEEQTRLIFETNTLGLTADNVVRVDDVVETMNHFRCIDFVIDTAEEVLSEAYIKRLHALLKSGTSDSRREWFAVGDYKRLPNEVGGRATSLPEEVAADMQLLLSDYHAQEPKTLNTLLDFHVRLERIHPFQDGNGRVGRLVMFKECLHNGIIPFIITDDLKLFYYRGLHEWGHVDEYLTDTCLSAQDSYRAMLEQLRIPIS